MKNCAACHGSLGQGGSGPPLNASGHAHHHADAELTGAINDGIRSVGQPVAMPGWAGRLSAEEIRQVIDFLKTLWAPEQRAAQQALNAP